MDRFLQVKLFQNFKIGWIVISKKGKENHIINDFPFYSHYRNQGTYPFKHAFLNINHTRCFRISKLILTNCWHWPFFLWIAGLLWLINIWCQCPIYRVQPIEELRYSNSLISSTAESNILIEMAALPRSWIGSLFCWLPPSRNTQQLQKSHPLNS